ncbi:MAG: hypothetical protein WC838_05680 [Candidatus Margulisiibacteriota bacterium]|jgi:Flp pilus assembly pilin Flp
MVKQKGQAIVEYVLIAGLIGMFLVIAMTAIGRNISNHIFQNVANHINEVPS